jgi:hypothetical protein
VAGDFLSDLGGLCGEKLLTAKTAERAKKYVPNAFLALHVHAAASIPSSR